ncbi:MAG: ABC transporter permease [Ardenticatenaceae bacterium]|nr:ABC transporter permease [Ardenticatenaceae bacterium]
MNFSESFLTALDSLQSNKLRSALTMLGVIIGVAAVIALLSIGNGVTASITDEIESIGTNLITVSTDRENSGGYNALSLSDLEVLGDPLSSNAIEDVAAASSGAQNVVYGSESLNLTVSGVTESFFPINNMTDLLAGDLIYEPDVETGARVAVIGSTVASDLFGAEFPIGESIKVNGVSYEVVGVLTESGQGFGGNPDETVYIPLTTAQQRLYPDRTRSGERAVSTIYVQAASEDLAEQATEDITAILREQHGITYNDEDDFTIISQTDLLATFDVISTTLTLFLGAVAGISLLVGGIGIMNIMLVSVTERTREIGIRKAIGALRRDILTQFLLESVVLSLVGGFAGIILGWIISVVAGGYLDVTSIIDASTVTLAVGFAAGVGLIFGIYPAWRASSLRPIEALRYE